MDPNQIEEINYFENITLEIKDITEVNLDELPNRSEKYEVDQKNLSNLLKNNFYRYVIGSGDVLSLEVIDIEEIKGDFTVDAEGFINIPYAKKILVSGLTKNEAENLINTVLSEFYKEPQSIIKIKEHKSSYVYITGEVTKPQSLLLTEKKTTIKDAILIAGYIKDQKTNDKKAILKRKDEIYTIDLYKLINELKTEFDIFLREDDILHIQDKNEDTIFVFGEATQGRYSLFQNPNLTTLLSSSKINQITADASKIYIIREDIKKPYFANIYKIDTNNPVALILANKFELIPNDIIYVSPSEIVRWNRVISLITPQSGIFTTYRDIDNVTNPK